MKHMINSRVHWFQHGEKPSNYFCSLECQVFIDTNIEKVCLQNCETIETITDQVGNLDQLKQFYVNLFQSRDKEIPLLNQKHYYLKDV